MNSPSIRVGIMSAESITIVFHGHYSVDGVSVPSGVPQVFDLSSGIGKIYIPDDPQECFFEVHGVTIGVGFHWERREDQKFRGSVSFIREGDQITLVNIVDAEEYLLSVISSEMNANAPEEFLKAHAVISRSWLLAQTRARATAAHDTCLRTEDTLIRWYDHSDHEHFDVCADDHCQRYQGLTRQTSPAVAAAVDATKGMVLTFSGEICDARFSKCCGGKSETFGNCWEDAPHPYLEPVDDCDDSGDIFCCNPPAEVIGQVLNGYDCESPDFYEWEERYSAAELSKLVKERSGIDFGEIRELRPLTRGASGRIGRLLVEGTRHSAVVGKELEIRRWLSPSHLKSSWFDVERTAGGDFLLRGRGWGHGVGMCQIGAAVMGSRGYDMRAILHHYFPKAELTKIY